MTTRQVGLVPTPAPVDVPGGVTSLVFFVQDDEMSSTIDVDYRITNPSNVRFSSGGIDAALRAAAVGTNVTAVTLSVGFTVVDGGTFDGIDITANARPANGDSFQIDWTVPLSAGQGSADAALSMKAMKAMSSRRTRRVDREMFALVWRLSALLPELAVRASRDSESSDGSAPKDPMNND